MAADVDIANAALIKIGEATITSLSDDNKRARVCNNAYARLRDKLLRDWNWNFAKARMKIPQLSAAPAFGYDHAYQLPADILRVLRAYADSAARVELNEYRLEGSALLTDEDDVYLLYQQQITDVNAMDASFRDALACRIAQEIALTLTQSSAIREQMRDECDDEIAKAISNGAIEDDTEEMPEGSWVTERCR